jgi:hypothetical protein
MLLPQQEVSTPVEHIATSGRKEAAKTPLDPSKLAVVSRRCPMQPSLARADEVIE